MFFFPIISFKYLPKLKLLQSIIFLIFTQKKLFLLPMLSKNQSNKPVDTAQSVFQDLKDIVNEDISLLLTVDSKLFLAPSVNIRRHQLERNQVS